MFPSEKSIAGINLIVLTIVPVDVSDSSDIFNTKWACNICEIYVFIFDGWFIDKETDCV